MNRNIRRNIDKLEKKYPQEIQLIVEREIKSLQRLLEIDDTDIYEILRNNRIGEERAKEIKNKIINTLYKGE